MSLKYSKGFGLTEGLIAMVILSSGLLAIYGVHTSYLKSFADDRAKADMTSKMVAYLSKARSMGTCSAIAESAPSYLTVSSTAVSAADDTACDVTISGAWSSSLSDGSRVVHSKIFLRDLKLSDDDEFQEGDGVTEVGFLNPPTGNAEYRKGDAESGEKVFFDPETGLAIVKNSEDKYVLVENSTDGESGEALLESSHHLHRIQGRVYFRDAFVGDDKDKILIGAPDTSICRTFVGTDTTLVNYSYREYSCFVGTYWYGALGPTETTNAAGNKLFLLQDEDVCVGQPNGINNSSAYSFHPQPSLTRRFSNLAFATSAALKSGVNDADEISTYIEQGMPKCESPGDDYLNCTWSGHDFVITDGPVGSETAEENCSNRLSDLSGELATSGSIASNTGKYYALTGNGVTSFAPANPLLPYLVKFSSSNPLKIALKYGNNQYVGVTNFTASAASPTADENVLQSVSGVTGNPGEFNAANLKAHIYSLDVDNAENTTYWIENIIVNADKAGCVSDASDATQVSGADDSITKYGVIFGENVTPEVLYTGTCN